MLCHQAPRLKIRSVQDRRRILSVESDLTIGSRPFLKDCGNDLIIILQLKRLNEDQIYLFNLVFIPVQPQNFRQS